MAYRINEIFYSIQGEGARVGTPAVFIRFADCNLGYKVCPWCDTDWTTGKKMTVNEIVAEFMHLAPTCSNVILTGGEPLRQYDQELYDGLRLSDVTCIAVETNGSVEAKAELDWVTCSPKVAPQVVARVWPKGVSEFKYVVTDTLPEFPKVKAKHHFLSPVFRDGKVDPKALDICVKAVTNDPRWRLSVQTHKLLGIQ